MPDLIITTPVASAPIAPPPTFSQLMVRVSQARTVGDLDAVWNVATGGTVQYTVSQAKALAAHLFIRYVQLGGPNYKSVALHKAQTLAGSAFGRRVK